MKTLADKIENVKVKILLSFYEQAVIHIYMHKNWYRGKWRVSKEVAPMIMEMLNSLTKGG